MAEENKSEIKKKKKEEEENNYLFIYLFNTKRRLL